MDVQELEVAFDEEGFNKLKEMIEEREGMAEQLEWARQEVDLVEEEWRTRYENLQRELADQRD